MNTHMLKAAAAGPPPEIAGAVLTIRLDAIQDNWRFLAARAKPAICGAAVKGDAYGLGIGPVSKALWAAGCRDFFVARPLEGAELRALLPREAMIYVLDGLFPGQAEFYAAQHLCPALISLDQAREWAAFGRVYGRKLPCALHADTGINRLGFSAEEVRALLADRLTLESLDIGFLMSHLACADEPGHPLNEQQRQAFAELRTHFPGVPASFANSSGIFLGKDYTLDLVRPGIALYGGNPVAPAKNPMRPVAVLEATVLQLRDVAAGETVGYGATWQAARPTRIAILGAGYKDGIPRALSSRAGSAPAAVHIAGQVCPVIGRVSMDMMAIDVSDLPSNAVAIGTRAEIIGDHVMIDDVAGRAGTISYELLTRLGQRFARLHSGLESEPQS
jgi:alanine racemase